jgi:enoyl-CoA hydratase
VWTEERHNGVAVATYANPPMDYFTDPAVEQLDRLIGGWSDEGVRVVVLAGGGEGRFITHFDVEEILRNQEQPDPIVSAPRRSRRVQSVLRKLNDLPKPVIAALNGDAMGFGFELALSTDIRVGQRGDHRYGLPEVRLGIIPGGSGTVRLARLVGAARALDLIMRARVLTPEEALELGLLTELADDSLERAHAIAVRLAELPPVAVAMAKKIIYQGLDVTMDQALAIEIEGSYRTKQSPDAAARMAEYLAIPMDRRRDWLDSERIAADTRIKELAR